MPAINHGNKMITRFTNLMHSTIYRHTSRFAFAILIVLALQASVLSETSDGDPRCNIGPLLKTFGAEQWLVYSCNTDRNVVIVSASSNPAFPFVFAFLHTETGYRLSGEGTGNKTASERAFNELKIFTELDIDELIAKTKRIKKN
jgi:hypothetical protein